MKEFQLIAELKSTLGSLPAGVVGIGDDCAVAPQSALTGGKLLYTVDTLVDSCHFDRSISSPYEIGYKAAAVNISDIAAMGGDPKFLLISLQVAPQVSDSFLKEIYRGIDSCAKKYGAAVIGGDTTSSSQLALTITAIGELVGEPLLRSKVIPGDLICVSGSIGEAWAGLALARGVSFSAEIADKERCLIRHKQPEPQVDLGIALQQMKLANAAIDISDGLIAEAQHLAAASNVAIELFVDQIPLPFSGSPSEEDIFGAITGGDDYQLLFSTPLGKSQLLSSLGELSSDIFVIGRAGKSDTGKVTLFSSEGGSILELRGRQAGYQHL